MKKWPLVFITLLLVCGLLLSGGHYSPAGVLAADGDGVLNLYGIDPYTLDPALSGDMTSHSYIVQIFSGLVRLDNDLEPVPDIAQEWQVSDDGRTYTFYLHEDVRFHDGTPLKADDFKFSWERACNPATGSQTAATYLGDIVGANEVIAGTSEEISGVRVIDDYTLEVTIDAPKGYFLYKLSYPTAFVIDRENLGFRSTWWRDPNGTGPFKLHQWIVGNILQLERNELYYGEVAKLDAINYYLWSGRPMDLYEMGEIDIAGISSAYIDKAADKAGSFHEQLGIVPELSFFYLGFNHTRPPFDDVNIRHAFSLAVDRRKIVSLLYRDMVAPAAGILPPGMPGFNEELTGLDYDIEQARELIALSEYGDVTNLPSITVTTIGWGGNIGRELEAIIYQWRTELGVEVTVRQMEPEPFLYGLKEEKDEIYLMGWIADYPHPQNFLEVLFHSRSERNDGEYNNPEVDAMLAAAAATPDREQGLELYRQVEQKLVGDAACFPLWFGRNYILIRPYVKGYELNPSGIAMLNMVWVEPH